MKIMVFYVEEEGDLRVTLEGFLKKRYDVVSIDKEDEALELYRSMKEEIDVVIVEFMMEHGIRLIQEIEAINPKQKVITLSGSAMCSCEKGCSYCATNLNRKRVMKPVEIPELISAINDFDSARCQLRGECEPIDRNRDPYFF